LIITGEGELNFTTKYHKTVWEVILVGKKKNIPIVIVTGKVGGDVSFLHFSHILKIFPLSNSFNEKVKSQTPKKLQQIAKNLYPFISETKREYSTT
jgi:glycerate kinase